MHVFSVMRGPCRVYISEPNSEASELWEYTCRRVQEAVRAKRMGMQQRIRELELSQSRSRRQPARI
jgi:hypothetical protein